MLYEGSSFQTADFPTTGTDTAPALADFDGDGNWDIFLGNGNPLRGYENALIRLIPHTRGIEWIDRSATIHTPAPTDTSLSPNTAIYPYRSHGTVFYDFDGDHDVDLYIGNGGAAKLDHLAETNDPTLYSQREPNRFFRNDTEREQNWLQVRIERDGYNRYGIGSQLVLTSESNDDWYRSHVIRSSSGFNSSRPPLLGLGAETGPFTLTIRYPEGAVQTIQHIQPNTEVILSP